MSDTANNPNPNLPRICRQVRIAENGEWTVRPFSPPKPNGWEQFKNSLFCFVKNLPSILDLSAKQTWVVDGFLADGSVTMLTAESGHGKSYLAYYIANAVATGKKVFGEPVQQREVLYVDGENPLSEVKERFNKLGIQSQPPNLQIWGLWNDLEPEGPGSQKIIEYVRQHKPLIIFDSLIKFNPGDEQSASDMRPYMDKYRRLATLGASVLILHHASEKGKKAQEYRGSSDIKASVDMAFLLTMILTGRISQFDLKPWKARLGELPTRLLHSDGKEYWVGGTAKPAPDPLEDLKGIVGAHPGMNQGEIIEMAKEARIKKSKALELLEDTNVFRYEVGQHNSKHYYLVESASVASREGGLLHRPAKGTPQVGSQGTPNINAAELAAMREAKRQTNG